MNILETDDYEAMSRQAANILFAQVVLHPESVLGLATGSTPLGIYRRLAELYQQGDVDFSRIRSVNLDEYCGLGPNDPQSYHRFMEENLFRLINIPEENTSLPDGMAVDTDAECARYDRRIQELGGIDLQLLGIGNTGHIGFNEPGCNFEMSTHRVVLAPETRRANARFFQNPDEVPCYAITMGIKNIMSARKILLAVNGKGKAEVLAKALFGPVTPQVPASILQLHPDVTVVADRDALSRLPVGSRAVIE